MKGSPITITESGVILLSGKPIRVYGVSLTSGAASGLAKLHNGTTATEATSPTISAVSGAPNQSFQMEGINSEGLYFPSGLYVEMDGNTSSVTVWAEMTTRA